MHVTISQVKSSADRYGCGKDDGHHEITICIPVLTGALNRKLRTALTLQKLRQMTAFVQFFHKLGSAPLGSQRGAGKYSYKYCKFNVTEENN